MNYLSALIIIAGAAAGFAMDISGVTGNVFYYLTGYCVAVLAQMCMERT